MFESRREYVQMFCWGAMCALFGGLAGWLVGLHHAYTNCERNNHVRPR